MARYANEDAPPSEAEQLEAWFAHPELRNEMDAVKHGPSVPDLSAEGSSGRTRGVWQSLYHTVRSAVNGH